MWLPLPAGTQVPYLANIAATPAQETGGGEIIETVTTVATRIRPNYSGLFLSAGVAVFALAIFSARKR